MEAFGKIFGFIQMDEKIHYIDYTLSGVKSQGHIPKSGLGQICRDRFSS